MKVRSSFLVMLWIVERQTYKMNLNELLQENQLIISNLLPGAPQTGQRSGAEPAWV